MLRKNSVTDTVFGDSIEMQSSNHSDPRIKPNPSQFYYTEMDIYEFSVSVN